MLENPYSPLTVNAENGASVYRGEGNVEMQADGEVMSICWDSTFTDSLELNTYLLHQLGTFQGVRKRQKLLLISGVVLSIVGMIVLLSGLISFADRGMLISVFIAIIGPVFILTGMRYQSSFKARVEKAVKDARGDSERIDVTIKISPIEVSAQEQKYKLAYLWAGITKIDVTNYGIVFVRDQAGAIQIPLRLFRSSIEAEQCVVLAKKYWAAARSSPGQEELNSKSN